MQLWLRDMDKTVELNGLKPVTNPISFRKGMVPTSDGLFSSEIFGVNSSSRKWTYAYIDLKKHYLNPKVYTTLKAVNRRFIDLIYGNKFFKVVDGQLVEDENGETGVEFLYRIWNKLEFKRNDSAIRSVRVEMLETNKRNVIFIDKLPVMPAFYRDMNTQGKSSGKVKVHEINDLYNSVIRTVDMVESSANFDFMVRALEGKVQDTILDIYNLLKEKVQGKNGIMRKFVMGSSIDYSCRVTITATAYHTNTYKEQPIKMNSTGVPLSYCISLFKPFIIYWLKRFFKVRLENNYRSFPYLPKGASKPVYVQLEKPEIFFNEDYFEKVMERWIETPSSRFEIIRVPVSQKSMTEYKIKPGMEPMLTLIGYNTTNTTMKEDSHKVVRPLTWTDVFYMAAVEMTADKHVEVTRYPMLDYLGTYFAKVHVLSTRKTIPMIIDDHLYEYYPVVDLHAKGMLDGLFVDSLKQSAVYLKGLDGDHDGDQTTVKGIMSVEANSDAETLMYRKINLITIDGKIVRTIGNEAIQTLYSLTRFKD